MASSPVAMGTAVFQPGPHPVATRHVDQSQVPGVPKPLMVVTPADAGTYPVALFLHGCNLVSSWYERLLSHVASHGFIDVAPQLYGVALNLDDLKDIHATRELAAWLADNHQGLAHVLTDVLALRGVSPDLSRLALAGHSRGGDTAFAVALGLGLQEGVGNTAAPPKFSALVVVDPVAGLSRQAQVEPKVLTFEPRSLPPGMPVLVVGTGLGPKHIGGPPCSPAGVNHAEFYDECAPPRYHVVVRDYGHLDMLDDGLPYLINNCMCMRNLKGSKDDARRAFGGVVVAFLRAALQDDDEDLKLVLKNPPSLAPAVLDPPSLVTHFRLALAGHSRGGDTAFAVALGLKGKHVRHPIPLDVNFSALVGVDPVGGVAVELGGWLPPLQWTVEPNVLSGPFDPRMPVLVVGTGRGPEGLFPCAPAGMNHPEFYELYRHSPRHHFDVKDFGHVDMLDDDEPPFPLRWCPGNDDHTGRELCMQEDHGGTHGGLLAGQAAGGGQGPGSPGRAP
ncbi:hypothetical protein C2845_PM13G25920 [Panicum miliaceum]|uniref:Uncharacterized protein n=1 Tax=Panicum miliaceum TaxID=4540 RepID=A0A3L6RMR8_PANMI|nr:hypothetical protein C2845_PM13G25920 [Panicum miliaceum]